MKVVQAAKEVSSVKKSWGIGARHREQLESANKLQVTKPVAAARAVDPVPPTPKQPKKSWAIGGHNNAAAPVRGTASVLPVG